MGKRVTWEEEGLEVISTTCWQGRLAFLVSAAGGSRCQRRVEVPLRLIGEPWPGEYHLHLYVGLTRKRQQVGRYSGRWYLR